MNTFTKSIAQIFKDAYKAFETFPAAILNALAFAVVTIIRIHLEWPQQEAYNFFFNCLHWSFAFGAIWSLMAITAAQSQVDTKKTFVIANISGILIPLATFVMLYYFGQTTTAPGARYAALSQLATARVATAILISFIGFILLAGRSTERSSTASALFMVHKAFFVALIYGVVIMSGVSGVAGAIEALLFQDMSSKVYMYIGTLTGFLAFTIFLGYFPDFKKGVVDERWVLAQKQPRFIEILFNFIMVPIALAMTLVLLLWAGKIVVMSDWPNFSELAAIVTSFAVGGIWLHLMVTKNEGGLPNFYRRGYPIAALVILLFSAWALFVQLGQFGLKLDSYYFILMFIGAAVASGLLLIKHPKSHQWILITVCVLAMVSVLPVVGFKALPVAAQVQRLEKLLIKEGMLVEGQLKAAQKEPEQKTKEGITDAVMYLVSDYEAVLPTWMDKQLSQNDIFKAKLGFEQTWYKADIVHQPGSTDYLNTSLSLASVPVEITGYRWAVKPQEGSDKGNSVVGIVGDKGTYAITWILDQPNNIPTLKVMKDNTVLIEEDLNAYMDQLSALYPPGVNDAKQAPLKDMSLVIETPELKVYLVFSNIDINVNVKEDTINYWINLSSIYVMEK